MKPKSLTDRRLPPVPRQLPQSLAVQTVAMLREKIQSGYWPRLLPSEGKLSAWLLVGRGTIRTALTALAREGLIRSRHGTGWEIVNVPKKAPVRPLAKNLVLLTSRSLTQLGFFEVFCID